MQNQDFARQVLPRGATAAVGSASRFFPLGPGVPDRATGTERHHQSPVLGCLCRSQFGLTRAQGREDAPAQPQRIASASLCPRGLRPPPSLTAQPVEKGILGRKRAFLLPLVTSPRFPERALLVCGAQGSILRPLRSEWGRSILSHSSRSDRGSVGWEPEPPAGTRMTNCR